MLSVGSSIGLPRSASSTFSSSTCSENGFGTTVCALVRAGLGIAVIDQFTVAHGSMQGIVTIPIEEETQFQTYVAVKNDKAPSLYAETFVRLLREEMNAVVSPRLSAQPEG